MFEFTEDRVAGCCSATNGISSWGGGRCHVPVDLKAIACVVGRAHDQEILYIRRQKRIHDRFRDGRFILVVSGFRRH